MLRCATLKRLGKSGIRADQGAGFVSDCYFKIVINSYDYVCHMLQLFQVKAVGLPQAWLLLIDH